MSFKDIKSQDRPIEILQGYIKQSRLKNSYLFAGPENVGKNLIAKTLAKAINCQVQDLDSCDKCISCLKIEKNQHPDVHLIDNDNLESIKIEHIRQLQRDINLRPYEGKKKVFIINHAHNLTAEASNALLKILEEPPQNSLIILITAKPSLLFKTIISRCTILKFSSLKRRELESILKRDYHLDVVLAHFLAYFSEGRIGQALRLKETDILSEKNRIINEFVLARKPNLDNLQIQNKNNLRDYLNILASWFRDIYLIKIGIPHLELIHLDRKADLLRLMSRHTFLDLDGIFTSLSDSLLYLEQNINIKLLLSNLSCTLIH